MKASDLKPGDKFTGDPSYVIERIERDTVPSHDLVYAYVRSNVDGGTDIRKWLASDDVPNIVRD